MSHVKIILQITLGLGAGFAHAKNLVAVPSRIKPELAAGFFLDFFEFRPVNFLNPAALHADQVIVVGSFQLELELRRSVGARDMVRQAALFQHF